MGCPQIVFTVLYGLTIGMDLVKHGEPKTGEHNIWTTLISVGLSATLLAFGGFWS